MVYENWKRKMKKIVITSILNKNEKDAGPKAKNDDRAILINQGFTPLDIVVRSNRLKKFIFSKFGLKKLVKENAADEYVIQYPLYSMIIIKELISAIRKYHVNAKIIILIHDIESLRIRKGDYKYKEKEKNMFNNVDALIVHNDAMKKYLEQQEIETSMISQGVFDYLNNQKLIENKEYRKTLCFAGNLEKSLFLKKLELHSAKCNVYGLPKPENYKQGVIYKGSFSADELPKYLDGDFGLIWDGPELKTNDGIYGEYTKFNSPHKASLYLSSGIPVIVWDKAGIAPLIQKNKLGIVVKSIENLDNILDKISRSEYMEMKDNAEKYALKIRKGENVINAIKRCEEIIC